MEKIPAPPEILLREFRAAYNFSPAEPPSMGFRGHRSRFCGRRFPLELPAQGGPETAAGGWGSSGGTLFLQMDHRSFPLPGFPLAEEELNARSRTRQNP